MNLLSRVACPYCYHRVDGRRLWYQCTGRGSPGRPGCAAARDEERERETGNRALSRPAFPPTGRLPVSPAQAACPKCGGVTGIRACPRCHTPVSANFGASASPLIAMVGATGTGKSVYLNVLGHELVNGLRRRFDADVRVSGPTPDDLFRGRTLFAQTAQATSGRREPVVFEWRQKRRLAGLVDRFQTTYLSFYDTAGEDLTKQDTVYDLAYLSAADALILLLDPFMIPHARDQIRLPDVAVRAKESTVAVVNRITEALRSSHGVKSQRTIRIPVAVAFAKIDAFFDVLGPDHPLVRRPVSPPPAYDEAGGRQTHEEVRALLHQWDADDIDAHLRFNYANFRYFAVSALGEQPDYANFEIDERGIRPFRVDEPLVWLLSKFNVVPALGVR